MLGCSLQPHQSLRRRERTSHPIQIASVCVTSSPQPTYLFPFPYLYFCSILTLVQLVVVVMSMRGCSVLTPSWLILEVLNHHLYCFSMLYNRVPQTQKLKEHVSVGQEAGLAGPLSLHLEAPLGKGGHPNSLRPGAEQDSWQCFSSKPVTTRETVKPVC